MANPQSFLKGIPGRCPGLDKIEVRGNRYQMSPAGLSSHPDVRRASGDTQPQSHPMRDAGNVAERKERDRTDLISIEIYIFTLVFSL